MVVSRAHRSVCVLFCPALTRPAAPPCILLTRPAHGTSRLCAINSINPILCVWRPALNRSACCSVRITQDFIRLFSDEISRTLLHCLLEVAGVRACSGRIAAVPLCPALPGPASRPDLKHPLCSAQEMSAFRVPDASRNHFWTLASQRLYLCVLVPFVIACWPGEKHFHARQGFEQCFRKAKASYERVHAEISSWVRKQRSIMISGSLCV